MSTTTLAPIKFNAPVQPWEITAGDDLVFTFRLKTGTAYTDFTGWGMSLTVRDTATLEEKGHITVGNGITFVDFDTVDEDNLPITVTNGQAVIVIPGTATEALRDVRSLSFDLQTVDPSGLLRTFVPSVITGPKDYTRV